ncbi:MAG: selenide, water dikinase SelD [Bacteroidetes bacterium CHB5]|nr:selenide, water dikinase SelD [Bacteroidetes bacterium CHB5]
MSEIKLTHYSHGAGCGCKIAPAVLDKILHSDLKSAGFPDLLVGNESKDDAAVYELDNGTCIISTTDFFMPIVDDAFAFGKIASVNAISDVYAMGGTPTMALAILGWPINKLPAELAQQVLNGARKICKAAAIPLAGGHSIDSPEPIFGLAVTGTVPKKNLKQNNTAKVGDLLYLTKPLGVGIITTAQKRGLAEQEDVEEAVRLMTELNVLGTAFGKLPYVHALTDVTGFGLLGHLIEVCEGSGVSAVLYYERVPLIRNLQAYISKFIYPDNTMRNWQSYEKKVANIGSESLLTLCDPQTSGGLLVCVNPEFQQVFESAFNLKPIGELTGKNSDTVVAIK